MQLTHLSLFSGIGGIDLAAEWAGFETVAFCDKERYCQEVLQARWPEAILYEDIKRLTGKDLYERTGSRIKLISGGFPCQPFSAAGKRKGAGDDRHLWPEMLRVISECEPTWICGENVANLANMVEFESMLLDLEAQGYEVQPFDIPACAVNAKHKRHRIFIVAYSERRGLEARGPATGREARASANGLRSGGRSENVADTEREQLQRHGRLGEVGGAPSSGQRDGQEWQRVRDAVSDCSADVADTNSGGSLEGQLEINAAKGGQLAQPGSTQRSANVRYSTSERLPDWAGGEMGQPRPVTEFERSGGDTKEREVERDFRGMAHGVSRRVDRLRALGNAVVPQQIYPILKAIADHELRLSRAT